MSRPTHEDEVGRELLSAWTTDDPPPDFAEQVLARYKRAAPKPKHSRRRWAIAAVFACLISGFALAQALRYRTARRMSLDTEFPTETMSNAGSAEGRAYPASDTLSSYAPDKSHVNPQPTSAIPQWEPTSGLSPHGRSNRNPDIAHYAAQPIGVQPTGHVVEISQGGTSKKGMKTSSSNDRRRLPDVSSNPKSGAQRSTGPISRDTQIGGEKESSRKSGEPKGTEPKSAEPKSAEPKGIEPKGAEPKSTWHPETQQGSLPATERGEKPPMPERGDKRPAKIRVAFNLASQGIGARALPIFEVTDKRDVHVSMPPSVVAAVRRCYEDTLSVDPNWTLPIRGNLDLTIDDRWRVVRADVDFHTAYPESISRCLLNASMNWKFSSR